MWSAPTAICVHDAPSPAAWVPGSPARSNGGRGRTDRKFVIAGADVLAARTAPSRRCWRWQQVTLSCSDRDSSGKAVVHAARPIDLRRGRAGTFTKAGRRRDRAPSAVGPPEQRLDPHRARLNRPASSRHCDRVSVGLSVACDWHPTMGLACPLRQHGPDRPQRGRKCAVLGERLRTGRCHHRRRAH